MKTEGKYSSLLVARYMMAYANDNDMNVNITKLNKLFYALYGVYLVVVGVRLVDERPHAWPFGPVFPRVRRDFLRHKGYEGLGLDDPIFADLKADEDLTSCLQVVMSYFGSYNATTLVEWTHQKDSAWTKATHRLGFTWNDTISDEDVRSYFEGICTWER